jgi:hypothetical protein
LAAHAARQLFVLKGEPRGCGSLPIPHLVT